MIAPHSLCLAARSFTAGPSSLIGDLDFALHRERSFRAVCEEPASLLACSRSAMASLSTSAPQAGSSAALS